MLDQSRQVDVLLVGAGPTGLSLALALQKLGVNYFHIDKHEAGLNTSRAAVIHSRTMEVLEPFDVVEKILSEGVKVPIFRVREGEKKLIEVDFSKLKTEYPFTVMIPQNRTEAILLAQIQKGGGSIARGVEFVDFQNQDNMVVSTLKGAGQASTISSKWIVGCDGGSSQVRIKAGIPFDGAPYNQDFVLADVQMDWPLERKEVSLFFSPEGLMVVAPLPGERFRIVATVDHAAETLTEDFFQAILERRGPKGEKKIRNIVWSSCFHLAHRVAATNFQGRVILCGDASHVHSPAGGQGMNTGIQDATSLGEPLCSALNGDDRLIGEWSAKRHKIAEELITMTHRMTKVATERNPVKRFFRNCALSFASHIPGFTGMMAQKFSQLNNR